MRKIDLLIGTIIGFITAFLGSYLFILGYTDYNYFDGIQMMKSHGVLGKVITLGAILNIIVFFVLLKLNKDLMARGIILAIILQTILTLLV